MIYCFDIDGTLCSNTWGDYEQAEPFPEIIVQINALYEAGHEIILFTARGTVTGIDWRELTEGQLHSWGVKYHKLLFGKPYADIYVDDKGISPQLWMDSLDSRVSHSTSRPKGETYAPQQHHR